jgi:hypothetical protein
MSITVFWVTHKGGGGAAVIKSVYSLMLHFRRWRLESELPPETEPSPKHWSSEEQVRLPAGAQLRDGRDGRTVPPRNGDGKKTRMFHKTGESRRNSGGNLGRAEGTGRRYLARRNPVERRPTFYTGPPAQMSAALPAPLVEQLFLFPGNMD